MMLVLFVLIIEMKLQGNIIIEGRVYVTVVRLMMIMVIATLKMKMMIKICVMTTMNTMMVIIMVKMNILEKLV